MHAIEKKRVASFGTIDETLKTMLADGGIYFNEDGTLKDPARYYSFMCDVSALQVEYREPDAKVPGSPASSTTPTTSPNGANPLPQPILRMVRVTREFSPASNPHALLPRTAGDRPKISFSDLASSQRASPVQLVDGSLTKA